MAPLAVICNNANKCDMYDCEHRRIHTMMGPHCRSHGCFMSSRVRCIKVQSVKGQEIINKTSGYEPIKKPTMLGIQDTHNPCGEIMSTGLHPPLQHTYVRKLVGEVLSRIKS